MTSPSASSPTFTVLLTACIAPKKEVGVGLRRADPAVRLNDYREALKSWLRLNDARVTGIVFADNSGFPLETLTTFAERENSFGRALEFHSFDYPAPPEGMNYGYSEFLLVRETLQRSEIASSSRHFIKATGRYRYPSISRLLARVPNDFLAAVDCRGVSPLSRQSQPLAVFALALFDRAYFLRELASLAEDMRPGPPWNSRKNYIEFLLFDYLYARRDTPGLILRWPCTCEPDGVGSNGVSFSSPRARAVRLLRAVARRAAPSWWI